VLREVFSQAELDEMASWLQPDKLTGLDYYPLPAQGERFPHCDPGLAPRLEPRPSDPVRFFQGILEGIAAIERQGYEQLRALGAPRPVNVRTVGGGARNPAWTRIRQRLLGVEVTAPAHADPARGTAELARNGSVKISRAAHA
jgi:sugar (pentulose or hexulose) kinase